MLKETFSNYFKWEKLLCVTNEPQTLNQLKHIKMPVCEEQTVISQGKMLETLLP